MLSRCAGKADGFSLIEVLVTVFVVSIGLLSVAGLQAISKKSNFDAIQRNTASALAQEILEHVRANRAAGNAYAASFDINSLPSNPGACAPTGTAGVAACTPAQIAGSDLYTFGQDVAGAAETNGATVNSGGLSQPTVCIIQTHICTYFIAIAWRGLSPVSAAVQSNSTDPSADSCGASGYTTPGSNSLYAPPVGAPSGSTMRRILVVQGAARDPQRPQQPCP